MRRTGERGYRRGGTDRERAEGGWGGGGKRRLGQRMWVGLPGLDICGEGWAGFDFYGIKLYASRRLGERGCDLWSGSG